MTNIIIIIIKKQQQLVSRSRLGKPQIILKKKNPQTHIHALKKKKKKKKKPVRMAMGWNGAKDGVFGPPHMILSYPNSHPTLYDG